MEPKQCEWCGIVFSPTYRVTKAYWARRRFCSDPCKQNGHRPPPRLGAITPLEERFWSKVQVCAHGKECCDCCWPWIGAKDKWGYGVMYRTSTPKVTWYKAHRLSHELFIGPIPDAMHVLHDCPGGDLPTCVNYNGHLWLGTQADNNADRDKKGRGGDRRGEKNGRTVISDAEVAEMRRLYAQGNISQYALGVKFGCSEAQARRIVKHEQRI